MKLKATFDGVFFNLIYVHVISYRVLQAYGHYIQLLRTYTLQQYKILYTYVELSENILKLYNVTTICECTSVSTNSKYF